MFTTTIYVRFADIDALGHVNNATYLTYMETARVRFFQDDGDVEAGGSVPFIVAHASVDYKAPIPMGIDVEVRMWTSRIGGKSWDFDYEIRGLDGTMYATGKTVQVAYDYELGRSEQVSTELRRFIERISG